MHFIEHNISFKLYQANKYSSKLAIISILYKTLEVIKKYFFFILFIFLLMNQNIILKDILKIFIEKKEDAISKILIDIANKIMNTDFLILVISVYSLYNIILLITNNLKRKWYNTFNLFIDEVYYELRKSKYIYYYMTGNSYEIYYNNYYKYFQCLFNDVCKFIIYNIIIAILSFITFIYMIFFLIVLNYFLYKSIKILIKKYKYNQKYLSYPEICYANQKNEDISLKISNNYILVKLLKKIVISIYFIVVYTCLIPILFYKCKYVFPLLVLLLLQNMPIKNIINSITYDFNIHINNKIIEVHNIYIENIKNNTTNTMNRGKTELINSCKMNNINIEINNLPTKKNSIYYFGIISSNLQFNGSIKEFLYEYSDNEIEQSLLNYQLFELFEYKTPVTEIKVNKLSNKQKIILQIIAAQKRKFVVFENIENAEEIASSLNINWIHLNKIH